MPAFKVTISAAVDAQPAFGSPLVRRLELVQQSDEVRVIAVPADDDVPLTLFAAAIPAADRRVWFLSASEPLSLWVDLTNYPEPGDNMALAPVKILALDAGGILVVHDSTLLSDRLRLRNDGEQPADVRLYVGGN